MDHGLERQVAIKEYLPAALAARGKGTEVTLRSDAHAETFALGLESFINEARLLARFDHPALMRVYRFWEANGSAYMAMPYYEGVTVDVAREALGHPPDEAWLRDLLLPLLDALDVLHGASCHHRNISPQNILLQPDGRPILLDSGAARHVMGDPAHAATVILNPGFAPIEQYAESTQLRQGPWTDLYSLAAVAYYCVSGQPPPASTVRALDDPMEPLFEVVDRIARSFPTLNYSVAFVSAIERALAVRPQERPQSVAEFRRALLGGRASAEFLGAPPAKEKAKRPAASPPPPPSPEETAPFLVSLRAPDADHIEDAVRKRAAQRPPEAAPKRQAAQAAEVRSRFLSSAGQTPQSGTDEGHDAAWQAALDAALSPDTAEFGDSSPAGSAPEAEDRGRSRASRDDAKAGGWRRILFMGVAAAGLLVLGAGGWMMWSDHRDANGGPRSLALGTGSDPRSAPLLPPELSATVPPELPATVQPDPPATLEPTSPATGPSTSLGTVQPEPPAIVPPQPGAEFGGSAPADAGSVRRLPPPSAGPETAPGDPGPEEGATAAEATAEGARPEPPAVSKETPRSPPAKHVSTESNNPRVLCGPRTQFSLYRCMKEACDRAKYYDHPECKYLRVTDSVRPSS